MFVYGVMLFKGDGIDMDKEEAIKYIKSSADLGTVNAMFYYANLLYEAMYIYGSILLKGEHLPCDKKEASKYFKKSAKNGDTDSMFLYRKMLLKGD